MAWRPSVLALLALTLTLKEVPARAAQDNSVDRAPNLVLIIGDDVGWMDFGFMGSKAVQTPHLDRLAESGTVFTHAFAPDSVCGPVLRSLLTGRSPQAVAQGLAQATRPRAPEPTLREVFETLPEQLGTRGYTSFQGGKFFEGAFESGGFTHGMTVDRRAAANDREEPLKGASALVRGVGGRALGRETMQPLWDFLDAHRDGPFFVWYAPLLPHVPFDAPEEFARRYASDPPGVRGYRANMTRFDATVGQLIARLEALGIRNRTLVVYVSDNGWDSAPGGTSPGLGGPKGKGTLHEIGVRTPLVVSLPGVVEAGKRDGRLVSLLDVYPTLLDFAGTPVPRVPGRSLHPLLTGTGDFHRELVVGGGGTKGRRGRFLRTATWRYTSHEDLTEGLYLIEQDPRERREERNLADAHPELVRALRAALIRELSGGR